jgi:uncharacterized damage-inducible protein DinB
VPTPFVSPADEMAGLAFFLDIQRDAVLAKLEGLSDDQATRTPTASALSMLTIVKHLAFVDRRWFQLAVAGRDIPGLWPPADPGEEVRVDPGDTVASIKRLYQDVIAESRVIAEAAGPDDPCHPAGNGINVRWVMLHMIEETARHAGHADIIRESLDGKVGT